MIQAVDPGRSNDGEAGFTLVELLVSLALMAMMSAYAVGALRTFSSMERVSKSFEQQAEVDAAQRNIRQLIGDARLVFRIDENGLANAIFSGKPDSLTLISILNDRLERGGLYVLEFGLNANHQRLEMQRRMHRPTGEGSVRNIAILEGVERVSWRYCGSPCSENDLTLWPDNWKIVDRLPSRVALEIVFVDKGRDWPTLRIPLVAAQ
jgi:general secretion pathway protein J